MSLRQPLKPSPALKSESDQPSQLVIDSDEKGFPVLAKNQDNHQDDDIEFDKNTDKVFRLLTQNDNLEDSTQDLLDDLIEGHKVAFAQQYSHVPESLPSRRKRIEASKKKPIETHYDLAVDEVITVVEEMMDTVGSVLPENTYWAGSFYTIVIPFLLQEIKAAFMLPQHPSIGVWWNYIDAICSVMVGCTQITDETSHRPNVTTFKGIVNLLSGLELSVLTFISFSAFGGPGFAAAFFACSVISMDETVRAYRRLHDKEYWMKDSIAELLKLEELEVKLQKDVEKLKDWSLLQSKEENSSWLDRRKMATTNWTLERQDKRLDEYRGKIQKLREDITARARLMLNDPEGKEKNPTHFLEEYSDKTVTTHDFLDLDFSRTLTSDQVVDKRITKKCKKQLRYSAEDTAAYFMAFVGVLLTCIPIPPVQLAGIICIGVVSSYFLGKNSAKLLSGGVSLARYVGGFFSSDKEKEPKKEFSLEGRDSLFAAVTR